MDRSQLCWAVAFIVCAGCTGNEPLAPSARTETGMDDELAPLRQDVGSSGFDEPNSENEQPEPTRERPDAGAARPAAPWSDAGAGTSNPRSDGENLRAADAASAGQPKADGAISDQAAPADEADPARLDADLPGSRLQIEVPKQGRSHVSLRQAALVVGDDVADSTDWDLAFEDWSIYTNSGPSGPGHGAAFGPLDEETYLSGAPSEVPFLREDAPGGAFLGWYFYDSSDHTLWSRLHNYGVRTLDGLWKLQLLSYYGEVEGAPVSALYSIRYARVTQDGSGSIVRLDAVNGTAGGSQLSPETPSGCLDLSSKQLILLSPADATTHSDWDLCFRRDSIATNSGVAGRGGVTAVDLDAHHSESETLEQVQNRSADSEFERFDALGYSDLNADDLHYQADAPVSVFADGWYETLDDVAVAAVGSWVVQSADGEQLFLVLIHDIQLHADGAKTLVLFVRPVGEE
jgi:hypothetical protein